MKHTINAQIKEVERELAMRKSAYPRFVAAKKMRQAEADMHMDIMGGVLETLKCVRDNEAAFRALLIAKKGE